MKIIPTQQYKIAMPLPDAINVPPRAEYPYGIENIDNNMTQNTVNDITNENGRMNYLGAGQNGVAFESNENCVVKYTIDSEEAALAWDARKKRLPCVAKIYDVKKVQQNPAIWQIKMEKIRPLAQHEKKIVDSIRGYLFIGARYPHTRIPMYLKYLNMTKCLQSYNIDTMDCHPANIGYNGDGDLVLFDLGEGLQPNDPRVEEFVNHSMPKNDMRQTVASIQGIVTNDQVKQLENELKNEYGLEYLDLWLSGRDIKISIIKVPRQKRNQGIGSKVVQKINSFADQHGLRVILSPAVKDVYNGTTSRARLVRFYKRHGFVLNKGRNKDFSISEGMLRNPSSNLPKA